MGNLGFGLGFGDGRGIDVEEKSRRRKKQKRTLQPTEMYGLHLIWNLSPPVSGKSTKHNLKMKTMLECSRECQHNTLFSAKAEEGGIA